MFGPPSIRLLKISYLILDLHSNLIKAKLYFQNHMLHLHNIAQLWAALCLKDIETLVYAFFYKLTP